MRGERVEKSESKTRSNVSTYVDSIASEIKHSDASVGARTTFLIATWFTISSFENELLQDLF
jgi:hypothetical protein